MSRDVRPRILAGALFAEDLSYAEKAYLAIVTTIKASTRSSNIRPVLTWSSR